MSTTMNLDECLDAASAPDLSDRIPELDGLRDFVILPFALHYLVVGRKHGEAR